MDLINEIVSDHTRLRELIAKLLSDTASLRIKKSAFHVFWPLVESHTKAEEKTLYQFAKNRRGLRKHTLVCWEEHETARALLEKIKRTGGTAAHELWEARVKLFCSLVEQHLDEEEEDFLPEVRKVLKQNQSADLAMEYRELNPVKENLARTRKGQLLPLFARRVPPPLDNLLP